MNIINLIAFQLPTKKFIVVKVDDCTVVASNVSEEWIDTNELHQVIKQKFGEGENWNLTYVRMEHWNRPIEVDGKSIKVWSDEIDDQVADNKKSMPTIPVMIQYPNGDYQSKQYQHYKLQFRGCNDAELMEIDPESDEAKELTQQEVADRMRDLNFMTAQVYLDENKWVLLNLYWNTNTYKIHSAPTSDEVINKMYYIDREIPNFDREMQNYIANQFMKATLPDL